MKQNQTPDNIHQIIELIQKSNNEKERDRLFSKVYMYLLKSILNAVRQFDQFSSDKQEDIVIKILLKAYKKIDTLREPKKIKSWLWTITKRYCIDELRKLPKEESYQTQSLDTNKTYRETDAVTVLLAYQKIDFLIECLKVLNIFKNKPDRQKVFIHEVVHIQTIPRQIDRIKLTEYPQVNYRNNLSNAKKDLQKHQRSLLDCLISKRP